MDRFFNSATALFVGLYSLSTLCFELHLALPACVKPYYPTEALLYPLKAYAAWTGDCFVSRPPLLLRVNCCLMSLWLPFMLAALPAIAKGNKPWLRVPIMVFAACLTVLDFQFFVHYLMASGECKEKAMNAMPALIYHGLRVVCLKAIAGKLFFDNNYGKKVRKAEASSTTSASKRITRSKTAAKKAN